MATATQTANKFDLDEIKAFWTGQANEHGDSHAASWSERPVIEMEIRRLAEYLEDGDRVLDIGCANGFSTKQLAERKNVKIHGVDYIPEMIEQAKHTHAELPDAVRQRVGFSVGNIMSLDHPNDTYDKAITVRVVINLGKWEDQIRGIREAARVVRPGGLLMMSEATVQGLAKLNEFRGEWDLPPIPEPAFNTYLDEERVCEALADRLELVEMVNFASTYFVGTRVIKPLLARLLGQEAKVADPGMHWNRWFASLPATGDYGTQKLFVLRKRA
ncbi:MAG: class I SAM-dependent methyltransferase [Pirellulales bacterium]